MKNIILSADSESTVYSVPDDIADNLRKYCNDFYKWLKNSDDAENYRKNGILCFDETDFVAWLNKYVFPNQPSLIVENIGWIQLDSDTPEKYRGCPEYNF